jgi:hypothetical protein
MKINFINTLKIISFSSLVLAPGLLFSQNAAKKTLPEVFKSMSTYRGPFGKNIIQTEGGRAITPNYPAGKRIFQGAFRSNDSGRLMAREYDFYAGNLFSSNYYELMEEYVFRSEYELAAAANDNQPDTARYSPHRALNQKALVENGAKAMPRAASMARHAVLERYYVSTYPNSSLAKSFLRWGTGDSKDEEKFARDFLDFYLASMTSNLHYLPAFLLLQNSTVGDASKSRSLETARNLVAKFPHDNKTELGRIRNAIHNQLSPAVIGMIDDYTKKHGRNATLAQVRAILTTFYSFDPSVIGAISDRLGEADVSRVAKLLSEDQKRGRAASLDSLEELSKAATDVLKKISDEKLIPVEKKTEALLLLSNISQFLNSKITDGKTFTKEDLPTKQAIKIVLNTLFIEGLLIQRNWEFFTDKVEKSKTDSERLNFLTQATKIGTDTVIKAFSPSLAQWKEIEPKMENFIDSAVKSSALNSASVILIRTKQ